MFAKREKVSALVKDTPVPRMFRARQIFENNSISPEQIPQLVREGMNAEKTGGKIKPGQNIAIAVGSRGICNQVAIVKTVVDCVKERGAHPFLVPGMGCHGGGPAGGACGAWFYGSVNGMSYPLHYGDRYGRQKPGGEGGFS